MIYNSKRKMKRIFKHKYFQLFLGWTISFYLKLCFQTSIWLTKNSEIVEKHIKKNKSFIVCFWHNRLLMTVFCWKWSKEFRMLISGHADGKIISNAISYFGIKTITGSSRKHNLSSLKEILKQINNDSIIGITPDGPKGPNEEVKKGLISLLKKTNVPVLPLSYSAKFKFTLNTWDKFIFVTPFNKFIAVWGNPFQFDKNKTLAENKLILEKEIKRVTMLSYNLSN